ncbi:hypothetical protein [Bosea thiooxidans]
MLAATRPDEARVAATIATLPERLTELSASGPVLVLLGHAFGALLAKDEFAADRRGLIDAAPSPDCRKAGAGDVSSPPAPKFGRRLLRQIIETRPTIQYVSFVIQNGS